MTVFEKLIEDGKLLMARMEKQYEEEGRAKSSEKESVIIDEDTGWLRAAATAMERAFGQNSEEVQRYQRAMKEECERVRGYIERGHKSSHGDWNIWLIGHAIGLLAPYRYLPGQDVDASTVISIRSMHMGDKYEAGQAGAMGPHAQASQMTFQQLWLQQRDATDLLTLANQLDTLRQAMRSEATLPEHDVAVGAVAAAQQAAVAGDGPKMLEYLKSAGRWALDTATKIGVAVAAKSIGVAIGLPP